MPDTCEDLNDFLKCFDLPLSLLQTEESLEEQSVSNSQNEFLGYRESVVNPSGIIMETQEMRGREPGFREMEEWVDDLIWVRAQEDHHGK